MDEPTEDLYFHWLCQRVTKAEVPTPSLTHYSLLRLLHSTEYVWLVSGDDNRAEEGLELRHEYAIFTGDESILKMAEGCSVLEMLIAFAYRAEFVTDDAPHEWFWEMVHNLGLDQYTDAAELQETYIRHVLDVWLWRQYSPNGAGGIFPLILHYEDQRQVETWYQFHAYLDHGDRNT